MIRCRPDESPSYAQVYTRSRLPANLDTILLLLLVGQMPKFVYVKEVNALAASSTSLRIGDAIDGVPFVIGFLTVLRQFHGELSNQFFRLSSQLVNAFIQASSSK